MTKVNGLTALLLNDDSLFNEKGKLLLKERELWRTIIAAFDLKAQDEAIKTLEGVIDDKLNAP